MQGRGVWGGKDLVWGRDSGTGERDRCLVVCGGGFPAGALERTPGGGRGPRIFVGGRTGRIFFPQKSKKDADFSASFLFFGWGKAQG